MLRKAKLAALGLLKSARVLNRVADSAWRRQRLLILCYHGISLEDEHEWRPALYMRPDLLEQRLEALLALRYSVLPLGEALTRLRVRDLPPRSVAITFDDGGYDFYQQAWPLLKKHGLPITVYQSTYYTDHEIPIFNLMCSYLLWKRRGELLPACSQLGLTENLDLRSEAGRHRVVRSLIERSERENLSGNDKDEIARELAEMLGIDYGALVAKRILRLMNAREVAEISKAGVDVQLHTHRHRTPNEEKGFRLEISQNRERVLAMTGRPAVHFCYPSGVYRNEFFPWMEKEELISATTCDAGLVDRRSNAFLLPRFVDTSGRTQLEFESWLSGVGSLLAIRRAASQRYTLPEE
ncbi:MAG TPA: polysaccharide deacetylase family protein [Candidatus Sulfotelmatobacter sp.]|jgi:peptidoglycan/xylan/chitin deacetylase (PgdA/CDA1 family)